MAFFRIYQFAAPLLLFPLSYRLWLHEARGSHGVVLLVLSMPVLFAYVIPGIGTNLLRLWEFDTRPRLGRFRPHHGFVFGTAASLFAWLAWPGPALGAGWWGCLRFGLILGSLLGFWNWLYEIKAIRKGFIRVYTRRSLAGGAPEEVAGEYAPVLFGTFGFCYGVSLAAAYRLLVSAGRRELFWPLLAGGNLLTLIFPAAACLLVYWGHLRRVDSLPGGETAMEER